MATGAIETQGVLIQRGDGGGPVETFATIGEIISFDGPGGSASVIDATSLDSVAREKLMGLPDEGQFSFEMNLVPGDEGQQGLRADRKARVLRNFKITLTDEDQTTLTFSAFVLEFSISGGVDDKVTASCTMEISGEVVWSDEETS